MFYIHQTSCISPQNTFSNVDIHALRASADNKLTVLEPAYTGIPASVLRRMGKVCRIGVGSAMPLIQQDVAANGMIIGTANGGMEESIRFLKQIIEYNEDMLAPGSFVQSTANAIASQLGMFTQNKGYNITHVHKGLAFENAVIDATMLLAENPSHTYLLGGVDEIASYNYRIEYAAGWYKKEPVSNQDLYKTGTPGSMAGEGAAMFIVNNEEKNATAKLQAITVLHSDDIAVVQARLKDFLREKLRPGDKIDLLLTGENGDSRCNDLFTSCETVTGSDVMIARFKHMCGEYPTASAFALWLACYLPSGSPLPGHMIKRQESQSRCRNILIYNQYQGLQHSFMLVSKLP